SAAAALIAPIDDLGVQFALDDFGTGYSSLASIKRFPLATVKIHQSFVADLGTGDNSGSVAAAIIAGAHPFGKRVVAEGVETEQAATALARLGCDHLQGHFCSRPLRAVAFTRFLALAAARRRPVLAVAAGGS